VRNFRKAEGRMATGGEISSLSQKDEKNGEENPK
jgi:hypothetical protein